MRKLSVSYLLLLALNTTAFAADTIIVSYTANPVQYNNFNEGDNDIYFQGCF